MTTDSTSTDSTTSTDSVSPNSVSPGSASAGSVGPVGAVTDSAITSRRALMLVYLSVFGAFAAQQILSPVLPPLARELGLGEFQLGVVITSAAVVVVLASTVWGRVTTRWGHRTALLGALTIACAGLTSFAVVVRFGLAGALGVPVLLALMLLTRGLVFGVGIAGTPVVAQAFVAETTHSEGDRVKGLAMVGAAQGLALVLGPAIGGALASLGLMVPLYATPVLIAGVTIAALAAFPRTSRPAVAAAPVRLRLTDPRVRPFLVAGFGLFLSLAVVQVTIGFLVQDRLHLAGRDAAALTGIALLAAGATFLLAQAAIVPRLGWPPLRLLRVGPAVALAGYVVLAFADNLTLVVTGLAFIGLGIGVAAPGYTAGATLAVRRDEQSGVAGLVGATNAATFVVGPLAGTALYEWSSAAPSVLGAVIVACLLGFLVLCPPRGR